MPKSRKIPDEVEAQEIRAALQYCDSFNSEWIVDQDELGDATITTRSGRSLLINAPLNSGFPRPFIFPEIPPEVIAEARTSFLNACKYGMHEQIGNLAFYFALQKGDLLQDEKGNTPLHLIAKASYTISGELDGASDYTRSMDAVCNQLASDNYARWITHRNMEGNSAIGIAINAEGGIGTQATSLMRTLIRTAETSDFLRAVGQEPCVQGVSDVQKDMDKAATLLYRTGCAVRSDRIIE